MSLSLFPPNAKSGPQDTVPRLSRFGLPLSGSVAVGRLRLQTLVWLRWIAIGGQFLALLIVAGPLGFALPMFSVVGLIGISVALNLYLTWRYPQSHRLSDNHASTLLAFDVIQLAALLSLTGGLENPFSILLMVPVIVSATMLPLTRTMLLGWFVIAVSLLLAVLHMPLPWRAGETIDLPPLYIAALWIALVSTLGFTAVYAWWVAQEARSMSDALAATELALAREQHLSELDGMAAAAAHELGTPLATITLVVKELRRNAENSPELADDLALLGEQTQRCREILRKISSLGEDRSAPFAQFSLTELLAEVATPHRDFGIEIAIEPTGVGDVPEWLRSPSLTYGLGNIVENAVDFAQSSVRIEAYWDEQTVQVQVMDDGPGFSAEVLGMLGEPYVTRRPKIQSDDGSLDKKGLGLGVFIAKTLLERTGASLDYANQSAPETGAVVTITWPRATLDKAFGIPGENPDSLSPTL